MCNYSNAGCGETYLCKNCKSENEVNARLAAKGYKTAPQKTIKNPPAVCDICGEPAKYDCKIPYRAWAFVCQYHFTKHGCKLGVGRGQILK